jgi:hypothetical protein
VSKDHRKPDVLIVRLDPAYAQEYEAAWLKHQADVLVSYAPDSYQPPKKLLELWISDADRWRIARLLRRIATTPAILKALTQTSKRRARRGRPVLNGARDWKIALDLELTRERLQIEKGDRYSNKTADGEVEDAWKLGRSVVQGAHTKWIKWAPWVQWAEYQRKSFAHEHPRMKQRRLLAEISNALRKSIKTKSG